MDEPAHPGLAAPASAFSVPVDVAGDEVLPRAPLAEVGGEVKGDLAAGGAGGDRAGVAEVAADRLGAEALDRGGRGIGARQRADPAPSPTSRCDQSPPMNPEPPVTKASARSFTPPA